MQITWLIYIHEKDQESLSLSLSLSLCVCVLLSIWEADHKMSQITTPLSQDRKLLFFLIFRNTQDVYSIWKMSEIHV